MNGSNDITKAIAAVNEIFMTAYRQGDAAGMANLYTASGQLLPPNREIAAGRYALQTVFKHL